MEIDSLEQQWWLYSVLAVWRAMNTNNFDIIELFIMFYSNAELSTIDPTMSEKAIAGYSPVTSIMRVTKF